MKKEDYLEKLVEDSNVDLLQMYDLIQEESELRDWDLYFDNIYSYDSLKEILIDHIENDDLCLSELLSSVEEQKDLYLFDWSCYGNGATSIDNKEELKTALLEGTI